MHDAGLRERKKQATRAALQEAALHLAMERGPEQVRVNDIADAAGVSPRTYNNYFSSREQAIVAAVIAEREQSIAAGILAQPAGASLSEAVTQAIVDQHAEPGRRAQDALLMITTSPALRACYAESVAMSEGPMADAFVERAAGIDRATARVLAASVGAASRVAIQDWLVSAASASTRTGLVVPTGSLSDRIREALAPLAPALDAAAHRAGGATGA